MAGSFRFEEGQAMKPTVYMEEMDAFTYREKLAKDAVVFIPVGALEQHGSHMAMCVDAALTKAMALSLIHI